MGLHLERCCGGALGQPGLSGHLQEEPPPAVSELRPLSWSRALSQRRRDPPRVNPWVSGLPCMRLWASASHTSSGASEAQPAVVRLSPS